jgi:AcrR family transcriptional regulator
MRYGSESESSFIQSPLSVTERHRREREARSKAILAAAARVFARHGLEGATIEMVARDAEVAVGTIYLYFASRDDLFLSLVAERAEQLRARYAEFHARHLAPLEELRAVVGAYLDYLRESRELFISQQSVSYAKLEKRLKRAKEIRDFKRVMDLGHQVFALWEKTIQRIVDAGLVARPMSAKQAAAVIWASLNGAFLLMGDDSFFRGVTGLDSQHFIEETLESHLSTPLPAARSANAHAPDAPARRKARSVDAVRHGRAKNNGIETATTSDEVAATASA